MKTSAAIISSVGSLLCVSVICATLLYACTNANQRYYEFANRCVSEGGTWVPTGTSESYAGACVARRTP